MNETDMNFQDTATLCCVNCDPSVQALIFDETFLPKLAGLLLIFGILAVLVWAFIRGYARHHNQEAQPGYFSNPVPLLRAALFLGIGIGGFIDGIVFHQILQWHQMLSSQLAPTTVLAKSVNMFWDGIFHAAMLLMVALGVGMLWNVSRHHTHDTAGRILMAGGLMGWGLFNIVEGIIDHHLLKLHNVREVTAYQAFWNYGFLGFSALLIFIGAWMLQKHASKPVHQPPGY